jgi:hypothetical protein
MISSDIVSLCALVLWFLFDGGYDEHKCKARQARRPFETKTIDSAKIIATDGAESSQQLTMKRSGSRWRRKEEKDVSSQRVELQLCSFVSLRALVFLYLCAFA